MIKILIALSVIAVTTGYVVRRVIGLQNRTNLITFGLICLELVAPLGDRLIFPFITFPIPVHFIDWVSYLTLGMVSCLFIYGIAVDISTIAIRRKRPNFDPKRRAFLTMGGVALGGTVVGTEQALAGPTVRRVEIPLKSLPAPFDGFTIAQISDLHVGAILGQDYVENVVKITNGLTPDMIVLTGDMVDGNVTDLKRDVAPLEGLKAPHGQFYITGNHEYYWGAEPWLAEFGRLGFTILHNKHQIIVKDDHPILLAGIPDLSTLRLDDVEKPDLVKALANAPDGLVKILLAHQPASYELASEAGFDLQLSGHTHAGQYFPFTLFIGLFQRYYKGLNRHQNMWVYVNSGTGYWGPPLRTANPTEITLLILKTAS
jgi:hypothetical protein